MTRTPNADAAGRTGYKVRELVLAGLFAALTAIGAFIQIPIPFLSFSLQTLFVALAAILLPRRWAVASIVIYIAVGLMGFPIFSRGGGIGYVVQPSFGFLAGFVAWVALTSTILAKMRKKTVFTVFLAEAAGVVVMYAIALPYYYMIMTMYQNEPMTTATLFTYCFATTFPGDLLKSLLAAWMGRRIQRSVRLPQG